MCHQNSARFYGNIAYDGCFNGLVTDSEEGNRLAAVMGGKTVLLHRNHGVIVCGKTVASAFDDLYYLERAAQTQVLAMSTNRPLAIVRDDVAAGTKAVFDAEKLSAAQLHLDAWKRTLPRQPNAMTAAREEKDSRHGEVAALARAARTAVRRLVMPSAG